MNHFIASFCKSFGVMLFMLGVSLSTISAYGAGPGDPGWGGGGIAVCGPNCSKGCSTAPSGGCSAGPDICSQVTDPSVCKDCHCTQDIPGGPCSCKLKP
jgi:hypothetical protein